MSTQRPSRRARRRGPALAAVALCVWLGGCIQAPPVEAVDARGRDAQAGRGVRGPVLVEGRQELEAVVSDFSRIRVEQEGSLRTLWFVEDDGREVKETAIDLLRPGELVIPYTRAMFASHLLLPTPPARCLLVGLGGGAMVQFLAHAFPETEVDAVEIDPAVVRVADAWFGTRPGPRVRIHTADGFQFVQEALAARTRWDVIYMDAYLKPEEDTDSRGLRLTLKTERFFGELGQLVRERGVVVFNMLRGDELLDDLRTVMRVFPYVHVIEGWGGNVVVAASFTATPSAIQLEQRARALDARGLGFSFAALARSLRPGR